MRLKITGGRIYDPASGWQGEVRDLLIEGDRVVSRLTAADRIIDAKRKMVVAGGIDLGAQVATYGATFLYLLNGGPTLRELGLAYAFLGYTHVHEPFLTPVTAALVHRRLAALPIVDVSASLVLNLRDLDAWLKDRDRWGEIAETIRFLLEKTRSLDVRLVEPFVRYRQEFYAHRNIYPDEALDILTRLALDHRLKFIVQASPDVVNASYLEPRAFHLAGLSQALQNGGAGAAALRHLDAGVTADCGLYLPRPDPGPQIKVDLGWYQPLNLNPAIFRQQARDALDLALSYQGHNLAFSAMAPTPVREYPELFTWLLDRTLRQKTWGKETAEREYSLSDWTRATRTLPAQILGLTDRGHLQPGARADVAIYDLSEGKKPRLSPASLRRVHTLIKGGEIVIDNFQLVKPDAAKATYFRRTEAQATALVADICQYRSFRPESLWVPDELGGPWVGMD
ncbi:MAG: amidohydrolase family protein [Deltaproteobacteria bacterium]|nr:amidohydrolase family protein [Deltaproteobacteria bacterium]